MEVPRTMALSARLPTEFGSHLSRGQHALSPARRALHILIPAALLVQAWTAVGSLCVAPGAYDGICSPAMDFAAYAREEKLQWSAMCGAAWCERSAFRGRFRRFCDGCGAGRAAAALRETRRGSSLACAFDCACHVKLDGCIVCAVIAGGFGAKLRPRSGWPCRSMFFSRFAVGCDGRVFRVS